ncbi:MAG: NAD(P)/FAD-dependent oxidoreductase [Candidatus Micrarchaeota archaeon]|nr:NAD(P)/FAD-dependent oxidoreductase [Candidatus Micrarchaeota archaeon]
MLDVHIVGGGPAGCFAGIGALEAGFSALISEEHRKIGEPEACSGLISRSGLESLRPYVDYKKVALNTITSAKIICGKQEFVITPKNEVAVLVSRSGLDQLAAQSFVEQGGRLELGRKVTRSFKAKNIVGADGPASSVAQHFGFPKIPSFVACMQGNFRLDCENPSQTEIYLSGRDFPGFFGWKIPINEESAKIGIGVSLPHHPYGYYRRFLSSLGVKSKPRQQLSAVIPTAMRKRTAMRKGGYCVVLAGDAAGQVKATTGGGVFFGARCGFLAGKYCNQPEKYVEEWKSSYWLDLSLHSLFRSILNIGMGEPNPWLLSFSKALLFEDLISEIGRMDRISTMLSPPSIISSYSRIVARRIAGGQGE